LVVVAVLDGFEMLLPQGIAKGVRRLEACPGHTEANGSRLRDAMGEVLTTRKTIGTDAAVAA
jgi:hypothetical protein